jgi:cytochrome c oxidase subunit 3
VTVVAVFLAALAGCALFWLWRQGVTSRPWLEEGASGEAGSERDPGASAAFGLGVFLAVVGALFALLAASYLMRMGGADWRPTPAPPILWFNTAVLAASSGAMRLASRAAARGERDDLEIALAAAAVLVLLFLAGQFSAWRRLSAAGYFASANPASAFFYLLTGLHGAHLIGGLAALARTARAVWRGVDAAVVRRNVDLCAIYWHFMLLVWIGIFALLNGWGHIFASRMSMS